MTPKALAAIEALYEPRTAEGAEALLAIVPVLVAEVRQLTEENTRLRAALEATGC